MASRDAALRHRPERRQTRSMASRLVERSASAMAVETAFSGKETVSLASNLFGEGPSRSIVYRLMRNGANRVKMQGGPRRFFVPGALRIAY